MTIQRPNCMKTLRQGSVSIFPSRLLDLEAVARPASGVSGYQDPARGHEEGAVANHRERPVLGTLRCGSAAERRLRAIAGGQFSVRVQVQNGQFCSGGHCLGRGRKAGQAAAHLLGVIEVEVLAHVHSAAVMLLARGAAAVPCVLEAVIVTADPLERMGRGVVDRLRVRCSWPVSWRSCSS